MQRLNSIHVRIQSRLGLSLSISLVLSTISRELCRNRPPSGRYSPLHAAGAYQSRTRREAPIGEIEPYGPSLSNRLAEEWTPEQIAGWLKAGTNLVSGPWVARRSPTRKSRTSSSPPISRLENAGASRPLRRRSSKSLANAQIRFAVILKSRLGKRSQGRLLRHHETFAHRPEPARRPAGMICVDSAMSLSNVLR